MIMYLTILIWLLIGAIVWEVCFLINWKILGDGKKSKVLDNKFGALSPSIFITSFIVLGYYHPPSRIYLFSIIAFCVIVFLMLWSNDYIFGDLGEKPKKQEKKVK